MLKLGRRARRHFVTLIEIRVHLIRGIFNLDPRALLLTEGKKRSWEPRKQSVFSLVFVENNQNRV